MTASIMTASAEFPDLQTLAFGVPEAGIGILRVNRPERMNSQTVRMFTEYGLAARALRDSRLRALILTAAGGIQAIRHLPFPVIAAVHGPAIGGGLALALAADIRLVSPTAKFSAAFLRVGLSMGELGTSYNLSRLIGPGRAAEIGYSGRIVGAAEAVAIGLANRVVPADRLCDEAVALARLIAANSPGGVRMSKRAIQRNQEITSYAAALELENRGQALLTRTTDMSEALAAFKQKRAPRFTGK